MKNLYDEQLLKELIRKHKISDFFSFITEIKMRVIKYKSGEYIKSPLDKRNLFQFLIEGSISIYYVRNDGSIYSLAQGTDLYVIGDLDLFYKKADAIYAEALTDVTCIALSIDDYEEFLMKDIVFVYKVAQGLAEKLRLITQMEAQPNSLEERVVNYLKYCCKNHTFIGIEKTAFCLHCSARQLQRVMNSLVLEGVVVKLGKGHYQLIV